MLLLWKDHQQRLQVIKGIFLSYDPPSKGEVNDDMFNGFEVICAWLEEEGDCDLHKINELQEQIKLMGYECYRNKRLKQKLKEKYGDCPTFSESCGRTDILWFKEFANYVLQEKKKEVEVTKEYC